MKAAILLLTLALSYSPETLERNGGPVAENGCSLDICFTVCIQDQMCPDWPPAAKISCWKNCWNWCLAIGCS